MDQDIYLTRYGLGKVIATGWEQYRKNFRSILAIFLIVYIPINIGLSFFPLDHLIETDGLRGLRMYMRLIELTEFLIGVLATMALAKLIESSVSEEPVTWSAAFRHALTRWGASIWTGLLGGMIIVGMCLLLIVPGIIWALYYSLFVYVVALRGLSGKQALDYSKGIVKGQWWRVLGYFFVIVTLGIIASLIATLPFLFTPDNRLLDIISDTIVDVVSAIFETMIIVFFLNSDRVRMKSEESNLPTSEPPASLSQA